MAEVSEGKKLDEILQEMYDLHAEIEAASPAMPTVADLRFIRHVERVFADTLEPLGYRVDRRIGIEVEGMRFQPTLIVMPEVPAEPDADYHRDFVGVIEIGRPSGSQPEPWRSATSCCHAPGCKFVVLVSLDEPGVEVMTQESDWRFVPVQGDVQVIGITVPAARLYR